jgi:hypothetical protein
VKLEVVGLSDGSREAFVSLKKSCDFVAAQWVYPSILKKSFFSARFFGFPRDLITAGFRTSSDESPHITAALVVPVQEKALKWH